MFQSERNFGTPTDSRERKIFEIINKSQNYSFGYKIQQLKSKQALDYNDRISSYYLRILSKDIPGALAKITSNLTEEGISIESILQIPEKLNGDDIIPIIIITHETLNKTLKKALSHIQKLKFVSDKIKILPVDRSFD